MAAITLKILCCDQCIEDNKTSKKLFKRCLATQSDVDALVAIYRCSMASKKEKLLPVLLHAAAAHPKQSVSDAIISALPLPQLTSFEDDEEEEQELKLSASCIVHMFDQAEKIAKSAGGKAKDRLLIVANLVLPSFDAFQVHGAQLAKILLNTVLRPNRIFVPVYSGPSFRQFWRSFSARDNTEDVVAALQDRTIAEMEIMSPLMRTDTYGQMIEHSWILFKLGDRPLVKALKANPNYRPYRVTYRHVSDIIKRSWKDSSTSSPISVNMDIIYDFYVFMSFWYMLAFSGDKPDCGADELEELVKVGFKIRDKLSEDLRHLHHIARWWGYWSPLMLAAQPEETNGNNYNDDGEAFCSDSD